MNTNLNELLQLLRGFRAGTVPEGILADWLEEHGDARAGHVRRGYTDDLADDCPEVLRDGNWAEAFAYAGVEKGCGNATARIDRALPNDLDTSVEPFARWDVNRVIAAVEGENAGDEWLVVGELYDGRFFSLRAGCDYTGWS